MSEKRLSPQIPRPVANDAVTLAATPGTADADQCTESLTCVERANGEDGRNGPSSSVTSLEATRPVSLKLPEGVFGNYELLAEVARGGMGVVYRARHITLNRVVALKMILSGRLAGEDDLQRFRTEAEAAARLQHRHIVAVHDVGEVDGQHYFSMDFIEGKSLAQILADGPLPSRRAARYVCLIARAIAYAHRQEILHRDLKPGNILIDAEDEPHITDFGLAKRIGGDSSRTRTGVVLGTPSYMAPEQAAGRTHDIGPPCDIYALGAILYELLTGRPPFRAETPLDTIMQVMSNDPVPPTLLNPKVDTDLETICLKCLEKEPHRRYPSAEALADDLQRYLNNETISARSFNILDRISRTLERSHHDVAFHTWSSMVFIMAVVICLQHVVVFALIQADLPNWCVTLSRTGQFIILAYLFWRNRGSRLLPTSMAERELWTIWGGYLAAYGIDVLVTGLLIRFDLIAAGTAWPTHDPEQVKKLITYPFSAIASGLAFFIMGSNYWGRCYAIGVAFWILAALMPLFLPWAPLLFGLLWCASLLLLGRHLRHLGIQAELEKSKEETPLAVAPVAHAPGSPKLNSPY